MRPFIVLLILCVGLTTVPNVLASPLAPTNGQLLVQKSSKTKAKGKSKTKKTTTGSVTLNAIDPVKHGKTGVSITATTSKSGLTCDMKLKYVDGSVDNIDSVTSSSSKICTFTVDIDGDTSAVGTASAEVTLRDSSGNKLASDKKDFTVK